MDTGISFEDVKEEDWFAGSVQYLYDRGIMTGLDDTHFGPAQTLNRAEFAAILYRMEGEPEAVYEDRFTDVPENQYYTDAVMWASSDEVGVIKGYYSDGGEGKIRTGR